MPKRTSRPRRFKRYRRSSKKLARLVKRILLNRVAEKKHYDVEETAAEVDWTGRRLILTEIAQGAGESQRIGRVITPHSFMARIELKNNETSSTDRTSWTAFLVQDLQQVGDNYAAVSEILSDNASVRAPMGLMNAANKGRFRIFKRWQGVTGYTSQDHSIRYLTMYHKFRKPKNVRYNGTASTDIEANGLMLVFITGADPAFDSVVITGNARMWYSDV